MSLQVGDKVYIRQGDDEWFDGIGISLISIIDIFGDDYWKKEQIVNYVDDGEFEEHGHIWFELEDNCYSFLQSYLVKVPALVKITIDNSLFDDI